MWYERFVPSVDRPAEGVAAIAALQNLRNALQRLDPVSVQEQQADQKLAAELAGWADEDCRQWHARARYVLAAR